VSDVVVKQFTFAISSPDELLVIIIIIIMKGRRDQQWRLQWQIRKNLGQISYSRCDRFGRCSGNPEPPLHISTNLRDTRKAVVLGRLNGAVAPCPFLPSRESANMYVNMQTRRLTSIGLLEHFVTRKSILGRCNASISTNLCIIYMEKLRWRGDGLLRGPAFAHVRP